MTVKKNYTLRRAAFLPAVFLVLTSLGMGGQEGKRELTAVRATGIVNLDAKLDEADWKTAPVAGDFTQWEPENGKPATESTEVCVLYDDHNIYFGVTCFDGRPDLIVAKEMRRDGNFFDDDFFEIIVDTFSDHRNAFQFNINSLGGQRDQLIRDEGASLNESWDGIWEVKTRRTKEGWIAEIAIPFRTLRFTEGSDQAWGINFGRGIARKRETDNWTTVLREYGMGGKFKLSNFDHLIIQSDLKVGQRAQIMPYVIGGGNKEDIGSPFKGEMDAGLDLKYRLTPNMTLDLTANTDFAQVEADREQFNTTPYSLYFPEKRDFFLEGADIFRFGERPNPPLIGTVLGINSGLDIPPMILFFSRAIGLSEDGEEIPVLGGARVTGKAGRYNIGAMNVLTGRTSYFDKTGDSVDVERANSSVFRIKRDILERSSIGIMGLSKDSLDGGEFNRATGIDFNLVLGQNFRSDGFVAKTFSPGLKNKDWAGALNTSFRNDFWDVGLAYTDIGENFKSDMGFLPLTDVRKFRMNTSLKPRPRFLGLRQTSFDNNIIYIEDHLGQVQNRDIYSGIASEFQNGSRLNFSYDQQFQRLDSLFRIKDNVIIPIGQYDFTSFAVNLYTPPNRNVVLEGNIRLGEYFNGNLASVAVNNRLKVSRNLNMEFEIRNNRFNLPIPGGKFTTSIASGRFLYSFTPNLFAKAYIQWNSSDKVFKSNFLIRWIYKPGANIYFIYNETQEEVGRWVSDNRTIMLKASFLFNY